MMSAGHRYGMIVAAICKRTLLDGGLRPADKLQFLQGLERMVDIHFTEQMVRIIEPASDLECKIIHEAMTLDRGLEMGDRINHGSFQVLTDERVFGRFVELNAGIAAVMRCQEERSKPHADQSR